MNTVEEALARAGSHERLPVLLDQTKSASPLEFMRIFVEWWSSCDDTWPERKRLLTRLRQHRSHVIPLDFMAPDDLAAFNGLPDMVPVYRGCSRSRIEGLSWTQSERVARGFAHGHRFIPVPGPVIVSAVIPKTSIFATFVDRDEQEIVLDPRDLMHVVAAEAGQ